VHSAPRSRKPDSEALIGILHARPRDRYRSLPVHQPLNPIIPHEPLEGTACPFACRVTASSGEAGHPSRSAALSSTGGCCRTPRCDLPSHGVGLEVRLSAQPIQHGLLQPPHAAPAQDDCHPNRHMALAASSAGPGKKCCAASANACWRKGGARSCSSVAGRLDCSGLSY
jgi:hypothetical protein